jgi:hypothetical protein
MVVLRHRRGPVSRKFPWTHLRGPARGVTLSSNIRSGMLAMDWQREDSFLVIPNSESFGAKLVPSCDRFSVGRPPLSFSISPEHLPQLTLSADFDFSRKVRATMERKWSRLRLTEKPAAGFLDSQHYPLRKPGASMYARGRGQIRAICGRDEGGGYLGIMAQRKFTDDLLTWY